MKPRSTTVVITPPQAEPVSVQELLTQLGMSMPEDPGLAQSTTRQMLSLLHAARVDCENDMCGRVLMMQTQEMQFSHLPYGSWYFYVPQNRLRSSAEIQVSRAPLMAILSFGYYDISGVWNVLPYDGSLGAAQGLPAHTYQRSVGTDTLAGWVSPGYGQSWPLARSGEGSVRLRFRCGYNGPLTVTAVAGSTTLQSNFAFVPDDVGRPIVIPGAGAAGAAFSTTIAAVNTQGNATLAAAATTAAGSVAATLGVPVPEPIRRAILIRTEAYYQSNYDQRLQDRVTRMLQPYRVV